MTSCWEEPLAGRRPKVDHASMKSQDFSYHSFMHISSKQEFFAFTLRLLDWLNFIWRCVKWVRAAVTVTPVSPPEDQIPHGFPNIDMGPQLKVVERTRTATMLCAASGNPDPEIYWFKDFLPVDIDSSNGRIKQLRSGNCSHKGLCSGNSVAGNSSAEHVWCGHLWYLWRRHASLNFSKCTANIRAECQSFIASRHGHRS